jgi:hypothetical protein
MPQPRRQYRGAVMARARRASPVLLSITNLGFGQIVRLRFGVTQVLPVREASLLAMPCFQGT